MTGSIKISEQHKDFFKQVYQVVKQIPPGRVTSYGAIARFLGMARSARMVGWAMNHSHRLEEPIPAHRVVNRQGLLTGKMHFGSPDRMQRLLEIEGITVQNDQVRDFEKRFWDPVANLEIP